MPFGMKSPASSDIPDIVKYHSPSGRMLLPNYDPDTRERTVIDITTPPPRFAMDFGNLHVGYVNYTLTGPDFRIVPEGQPLPPQPLETNEKKQLLFKPGFLVKLYGKVLGGLREFSSSANCVVEVVDDLCQKFRAAPEAQARKIPIVELSKTIPIQLGRGAKQSTVYAPCFVIVGWTDRVPEMGPRTVPVPKPAAVAAPFAAQGVTAPLPKQNGGGRIEDDTIPFDACWQ